MTGGADGDGSNFKGKAAGMHKYTVVVEARAGIIRLG